MDAIHATIAAPVRDFCDKELGYCTYVSISYIRINVKRAEIIVQMLHRFEEVSSSIPFTGELEGSRKSRTYTDLDERRDRPHVILFFLNIVNEWYNLSEKKEVTLRVNETTWMIPIDLSQCPAHIVNPVHIAKLPPLITVSFYEVCYRSHSIQIIMESIRQASIASPLIIENERETLLHLETY